MQNKLPLEYGPREADILRSLIEDRRLPSKNEGFRRGIVAASYLMDADRRLLLEVLGRSLNQAKAGLGDLDSFPEKLQIARILASEIVATFAVQKGIQSADSIDIFRAELDNYLVLVKSKALRGADKDKIANRLSLLSEMAFQFAKRESEAEGEEGEKAKKKKIATGGSERRPLLVKP
ncbi:MAG: hypothetical protein ACYC7D_13620 [Nitrososphaerales archaeon]